MESLPKQFVSAMRTLFDIMDDKRNGYVRLTDIENRWRDDRTKGLPRGVLESLQKVASHDGLLTFNCFCTGLKICLLRNQVETTSHKGEILNNDIDNTNSKIMQSHRPPSAPIIEINDTGNKDRNWSNINLSDNIPQHRTINMPLLITRKDIQAQTIHHHGIVLPPQKPDNLNGVYFSGPPKPPRLEKKPIERKELSRTTSKSEEVTFDNDPISENKGDIIISIDNHGRGHGDGRSNTESNQLQIRRVPRRREPRRHTLHNGVDYNLLKRMKQIEQEKDILLQGLSSVEEAREWYLKQLGEVQEKMRYAGRMGAYVEPWTEAQQERLELLRARIVELNRQLGALTTGWRRGPLSLHMNLALPVGPIFTTSNADPKKHAAVLRTQNQMLVEEVNKKNEKISVLEREKSSLIRELLLQRNRSKIMDDLK